MQNPVNKSLYIIYSFSIFLGSFLLFMVQPMMAKAMLPYLGGTPSLWQLSVAIYQAILLVGYLYAHLISKYCNIRKQIFIHIAFMICSLLFLPLSLHYVSGISVPNQPFLWVFMALILSISVPFFILSANSILLQNWFIGSYQGKLSNPYFLYVISNIGSLVSLLAYPLFFEKEFSLTISFDIWSKLFLIFLILLSCCLYISRRKYEQSNIQALKVTDNLKSEDLGGDYDRNNPSFLVKLKWILLSFVVSSLMLGTTSYITHDVGGVPMFWVLPLSLYLLSFIIAFSSRIKFYQSSLNIQVILTAFVAISLMQSIDFDFAEILFIHLLGFFIIALNCHKSLFDLRPNPSHLTAYYLFISLGGVLGGVFNGFLAPVIFSSNIEYILIILVATSLRPLQGMILDKKKAYIFDLIFALSIFIIIALYDHFVADNFYFIIILLLFISPFISASYLYPRRYALMVAAIFLANFVFAGKENILYQTRNFFGDKQVTEGEVNGEKYRLLKHGDIIHGIQYFGKRHLELEGYFTPLAEFRRIINKQANYPIAAIGLGAGNIACLGDETQQVDFYEIDPQIIEIAKNPEYFTYLSKCPAQNKIILGDGRLELAKATDEKYGLIVVDVFNADSVPPHFLTKEAFAIYLKKLKPNGIVAFDITADYLNLAPIITATSDSLNLISKYRVVNDEEEDFFSEWIIVTSKLENLQELALLTAENISQIPQDEQHKYWRDIIIEDKEKEKYLWRDDKYSILDALEYFY